MHASRRHFTQTNKRTDICVDLLVSVQDPKLGDEAVNPEDRLKRASAQIAASAARYTWAVTSSVLLVKKCQLTIFMLQIDGFL